MSIATASRSLSGHPRVDPDTRARVVAAAQALGYRPNIAAQALKRNRTTLVGLVLPGVTSNFYAEVSTRIQQVLGQDGYQVILCLHQEDPALEREHLLRLAGYQVAAIVHAPTGDRSARSVYAEAGLPVPYVVEINRHSLDGSTDAVCCADEDGVQRLAEDLIEHGHERIGMITAQPRESTARERLAGLQAALRNAGLPYDDTLVAVGEYSEKWGAEGLRRLVQRPDPASAVIIPANALVLGALRAVSELGLDIPADVSVVTFADFPWHSVHRPPLTSMQRPHEEMADEVCRLIAANVGRSPQLAAEPVLVRVPAQLTIRASVKTLTADPIARRTAGQENR